ncbi:MAG: SPOR domain-containing protein [Halofilum sp. (in: g-proteobacteria)]
MSEAPATPNGGDGDDGGSDTEDGEETGGAQASRDDPAESDEPSSAATDVNEDEDEEEDADASSSSEEASADSARPAPDAEGWVVQVGSFTRETNALVLRDRLREAGFDAFAEQSDNGERTLWRVRIGPVATREEADRLSERVSDQRGEPTLVMSHP